jgi:hypothetical protein
MSRIGLVGMSMDFNWNVKMVVKLLKEGYSFINGVRGS